MHVMFHSSSACLNCLALGGARASRWISPKDDTKATPLGAVNRTDSLSSIFSVQGRKRVPIYFVIPFLDFLAMRFLSIFGAVAATWLATAANAQDSSDVKSIPV
jgi:hypothetical protein